MKHLINQKAYFVRGMSLLLTGLLVSCQPPPSKKNSDAPTAKISVVPEKTANCEKQIRSQIEAHTLQLASVDEFKTEIESMNKQTNQKDRSPTYAAVQMGDKFTEIMTTFYGEGPQSDSNYSYGLSLADKSQPYLFNLTVSFESANGNDYIGIDQELTVNDKCEIAPASTSKMSISKLSSTKYEYKKLTIYSDGGKNPEETQFSIPENSILNEVSVGLDSSDEELAKRVYSYWPKVGVFQTKKSPLDPSKAKQFGLELSFENTQVDIVSGDKLIKSVKKSFDKDKKITLKTAGKRKTWIIPVDIFRDIQLGTSDDVNTSLQLLFSKDYLNSNNSLLLLTAKKPAYDHMDAYWKVIEQTAAKTEDGSLSFLLTENATSTLESKSTEEDLVSNKTIQVELPQIKEIAAVITKKTALRTEQIQMILNYLSKNYAYDEEMLKNNVIRPLTTEEALQRKKGVCQHYSVIFTAIARALKIPTRIVSGYSLRSGNPISHAWVESEIKEGTWRVIEPQSTTTLEKMQTRFYFPVARATHLENKDGNWAAEEYLVERTLKAAPTY